jgi:hypothetical protein
MSAQPGRGMGRGLGNRGRDQGGLGRGRREPGSESGPATSLPFHPRGSGYGGRPGGGIYR